MRSTPVGMKYILPHVPLPLTELLLLTSFFALLIGAG